jgi:hypothetical protein
VRAPEADLEKYISKNTAALCMRYTPSAEERKYQYEYDLISLWYKLTNVPLPLLIWAMPKGRLTAEDLYELEACMHTGVRNKDSMSELLASEYGVDQEYSRRFIDGNRRYYFDDYVKKGLSEFRRLAIKYNLLPEQKLSYAQHGIFTECSGKINAEQLSAVVNLRILTLIDLELSLKSALNIAEKTTALRARQVKVLDLATVVDLVLNNKLAQLAEDSVLELTIFTQVKLEELLWLIKKLNYT